MILLPDRQTVHNAFLAVTLRSEAMRVRYFEDTDTALIEFGTASPYETRELAEDLYVDLDADGRVVSITVEHASRRGDLTDCSFERIATGSASGGAR